MHPSTPATCDVCRQLRDADEHIVLARDQGVLAFIGERVRVPNSVFIAPLQHCAGLHELEPGDLIALSTMVRLAARAIEAEINPDGLNVWWAFRPLAGQTDAHLLVEVVPRFVNVHYEYTDLSNVPSSTHAQRRATKERLLRSVQTTIEEKNGEHFRVVHQ